MEKGFGKDLWLENPQVSVETRSKALDLVSAVQLGEGQAYLVRTQMPLGFALRFLNPCSVIADNQISLAGSAGFLNEAEPCVLVESKYPGSGWGFQRAFNTVQRLLHYELPIQLVPVAKNYRVIGDW